MLCNVHERVRLLVKLAFLKAKGWQKGISSAENPGILEGLILAAGDNSELKSYGERVVNPASPISALPWEEYKYSLLS